MNKKHPVQTAWHDFCLLFYNTRSEIRMETVKMKNKVFENKTIAESHAIDGVAGCRFSDSQHPVISEVFPTRIMALMQKRGR